MSVELVAQSQLPTKFGTFIIYAFIDRNTKKEHLAVVKGKVEQQKSVLTRVHSACLTGDSLFSLRCDCGTQLNMAMQKISKEDRGIILYLQQEGRGIGLVNKIRAYQLQDQGLDTVEANENLGFHADMRQYKMCQDILSYLKVDSIKLLTNNPKKIKALTNLGINIESREAIRVEKNQYNSKYLETKSVKLGHLLDNHEC